ncbi:hypothetical protein ACWEWF_18755, partial [Streptomyces sp. NPDC003857]
HGPVRQGLRGGGRPAAVRGGTRGDGARAGPGLVYLGVAIAAHALIAQALYGGFFVDIRAPIDQVQQAAQIMYYGGDIAELLLAGALVATWRPERRAKAVRMSLAVGAGVSAPPKAQS